MGDRHPMPLFTLHYLPEVPMSGHWYVLDSIPALSLHVLTINVGHPVPYSRRNGQCYCLGRGMCLSLQDLLKHLANRFTFNVGIIRNIIGIQSNT